MTHNPLLLTIPVALFFVVALIKCCLAFGECNFALHQMVFPIEGGADTGVAFLVDARFKLVELATIEQ